MSGNENNQQQQGDPNALGDAGKAALVAERKRADDAERALKDANAKLQAAEDANTQLTTDLSTRDLTILRLNAGIDEGLPKNLIARLQGTDEASIKADAVSLKELVPDTNPSPFPKADPSQGPKGKTGNQTTGQQFATAIEEALK